jgi:hypothetical protein
MPARGSSQSLAFGLPAGRVCVVSCPHYVPIPGWSLSDAPPTELVLEVIEE